jgi:hypothetical protein
MPTATVRQRRVAASDDRSGTPPNFELHGGGLLRPQRPKWNQKTDDTYTIGVDVCLPSASMCVL